jgi:hypothetical protein
MQPQLRQRLARRKLEIADNKIALSSRWITASLRGHGRDNKQKYSWRHQSILIEPVCHKSAAAGRRSDAERKPAPGKPLPGERVPPEDRSAGLLDSRHSNCKKSTICQHPTPVPPYGTKGYTLGFYPGSTDVIIIPYLKANRCYQIPDLKVIGQFPQIQSTRAETLEFSEVIRSARQIQSRRGPTRFRWK